MSSESPKTPQETIAELWELVVAYARQETVEPLLQLRRYIAFGLAGALLLGMGVFFCTMAALRALQTETGSRLAGHLAWIPYVVVVVALLGGAALTWTLRGRKNEHR